MTFEEILDQAIADSAVSALGDPGSIHVSGAAEGSRRKAGGLPRQVLRHASGSATVKCRHSRWAPALLSLSRDRGSSLPTITLPFWFG